MNQCPQICHKLATPSPRWSLEDPPILSLQLHSVLPSWAPTQAPSCQQVRVQDQQQTSLQLAEVPAQATCFYSYIHTCPLWTSGENPIQLLP